MLSHRIINISQLCSPARVLSLHCLDLNTAGSPDVPRCVFIWYFSQLWIIKVSYIVLGWGEGGEFHITRVLCMRWLFSWGFPHSLVGKESAWNARDPSSITGSGGFPGEGIGYPFQYSSTSLIAQLVKNPPAMQETLVWSLGSEDLLEKGYATHSSILGLCWWLHW